MPIYRGAQKVHPMPGGMEVARVYRGDRLVYTSAPPRYVAGGAGVSWNGDTVGWATRYTHTVTARGVAAGTWTVEWAGSPLAARDFGVRVLLNGSPLATLGPASHRGAHTQTVPIPEVELNVGDVLTFESYCSTNHSSQGRANDSAWSLS